MLALNPKHMCKVIFVLIAHEAFGGIKQLMEHIYIQNSNIREAIPSVGTNFWPKIGGTEEIFSGEFISNFKKAI